MKTLKVYLAGPDVFRKDAVEYGKLLKAKVESLGLEPLWPFDNEVKEGHPTQMARDIFFANLVMIEKADAVLANITPFRGPSCDPGTAFEMGYARVMNKPIFAYSTAWESDYAERVKELRDVYVEGTNVENFGLTDNLMVAISPVSVSQDFDQALVSLKKYMDCPQPQPGKYYPEKKRKRV